jgi:hypothetical protein
MAWAAPLMHGQRWWAVGMTDQPSPHAPCAPCAPACAPCAPHLLAQPWPGYPGLRLLAGISLGAAADKDAGQHGLGAHASASTMR